MNEDLLYKKWIGGFGDMVVTTENGGMLFKMNSSSLSSAGKNCRKNKLGVKKQVSATFAYKGKGHSSLEVSATHRTTSILAC